MIARGNGVHPTYPPPYNPRPSGSVSRRRVAAGRPQPCSWAVTMRNSCVFPAVFFLASALALTGCGTTRWSDTPRTATEQLLLSTAIDKSINRLDFGVLADKRVYFDPQYLQGTIDERYVVSALRQHLLASGCTLCEDRGDADYVVEARSGVVGTDRNETFLGTPPVPVPTGLVGIPAGISTLPQMTVGKNTKQRAVAKIAVYAYNRHTGRPLWQSGSVPVMCKVEDTWLLGAGPFHRRRLVGRRARAGDVPDPIVDDGLAGTDAGARVDFTAERLFDEAPAAFSEHVAAGGTPPEPVVNQARHLEVKPAAAASSTAAKPGPRTSAAAPVVRGPSVQTVDDPFGWRDRLPAGAMGN